MTQNFLKVRCSECGNEQKMFSSASTEVECHVCSEPMAKPTGGKAEVEAEVLQELEAE